MDIVNLRVAGMDGRKKVVWVAVRVPGAGPGERMVVTKSFKTFWRLLAKMAAWLSGLGVTGAAMERPGCTGGRAASRWPRLRSRCACAMRRICGTSPAASGCRGLPVDR
jgi:hypothetical protein